MRNKAFLALWAGLALVAGCREKEPMRIAVPRNFYSFLPCLADRQDGLGFQDADVRIEWVDSTSDALAKFGEGGADLAATGISPLLPFLKDHPDTRLVTEILTSTRSMVVVVKPSTKILHPRQLAGKKIGFLEGVASELFLEYFLLTEGVNLGSVTKIGLDKDRVKKDFLEGRLDAAVMWEPELSRMKRENPALFVREFQSFVHEAKGVLVGKRDYLDSHRERVDRLLGAWIRAESWLAENPKKAEPYIAHCLRLDMRDMETLQPALLTSRSELKLTNALRQGYDRSRDWIILRKGFKDAEIPHFSAVLDSSFLQRARSRSITLGTER
jgi:NitT/TauT family transport system substrate-binding protein